MAKTIDDMVKGFDTLKDNKKEDEKKYPITFWVPESCKQQYDLIQAKSQRRLGKLLSHIVVQSIERVARNDNSIIS